MARDSLPCFNQQTQRSPFFLKHLDGLLSAVQQRQAGRVGHVAGGVCPQVVREVIVDAAQLGALAGLQGLQVGRSMGQQAVRKAGRRQARRGS